MKQRIKELAEQATQRYDRLGFEIPFAQPDMEKFAELLIKECTDFAVHYAGTMSDISDSVSANAKARARIIDCALSLKTILDE